MYDNESLEKRVGKIKIPGTDATIEFKGLKYILKIERIGSFELPLNLGRHIVAFGKVKAAYLQFMKRKGLNTDSIKVRSHPWYKRITAEKRFLLLDCHFFVARSLGFPIPLKYRQNMSYTANHTFFPESSFTEIKDVEILKDKIMNMEDDINVGQILNGKRLTHSFFSLRINDQVYIIDSPGSGDIQIASIEERFKSWNKNNSFGENYGYNFGFASYEKTSQREDLIKEYSKGRWTD